MENAQTFWRATGIGAMIALIGLSMADCRQRMQVRDSISAKCQRLRPCRKEQNGQCGEHADRPHNGVPLAIVRDLVFRNNGFTGVTIPASVTYKENIQLMQDTVLFILRIACRQGR